MRLLLGEAGVASLWRNKASEGKNKERKQVVGILEYQQVRQVQKRVAGEEGWGGWSYKELLLEGRANLLFSIILHARRFSFN